MGKLADTQKKIEKGVVAGYKAIENGVVSGYKAIENGVVDGYKKIEEKIVGAFSADVSEPEKGDPNAGASDNE